MALRRRGRYDLDRILVVDLEATCWEGDPPSGQEPEVIEIGNAVLHVADGRVEPGPEVLVRPARSTVSDFCTQLTGLTQEMLDADGVSFTEAIERLRATRGSLRRLVWASFGDYDRRKLQEECDRHELPFPLSDSHINVKRLVALFAGWARERGMMDAMRRLLVEPKPGSRHHRGADDAINIARILARVILSARERLA